VGVDKLSWGTRIASGGWDRPKRVFRQMRRLRAVRLTDTDQPFALRLPSEICETGGWQIRQAAYAGSAAGVYIGFIDILVGVIHKIEPSPGNQKLAAAIFVDARPR
jgi:hypothetical protein